MIQVGLLGAKGRMGQLVSQLIQTDFTNSMAITAVANRGDDLKSLLKADVVIEFSSVQATQQLVALALAQSQPLPRFIIGSTGWSQTDREILEKLSQKTHVFMAPNFSIGVHLLTEILKQHSAELLRFKYTPVIVEAHHRHKKDSPSGTTISLRRAIDPQHPDQIQTHAIRAGEVIGQHEVTFYSAGDQIKISHCAQDRSIYARGALEVALWLAQLPNTPTTGILGMNDFTNQKSGI